MSEPRPPPALAFRGVRKSFGARLVLGGVDLALEPGEVHALLGENGAGKTTLVRMAIGLERPDAGSVEVGGRAVAIASPADAARLGVGTVHQHFTLADGLTVAENLALAQADLPRCFTRATLEERARAALARHGLALDPRRRVRDLAVGEKQRVEIVKALERAGRVLILDEPTAVLAPDEVAALFATLERLRASGRAILLITHKLDEVLAAAQRVTVLREGRVALTAARADVTAASLTEALFGERPDATPRAASRAGGGDGRLALLATNLSGERFGPVELTLLGGECVVLFGLDGNGQSELVETLVGLREPSSGALERPRRADEVAFVSGDRHATGLALDLTVAENVGVKRGLLPRPWFTRAQLERAAAPPLARFAVASASLRQPVRELSGGNQQKLVLARELAREPRLVVAENPTRGLDLRATAFVRGELRRAVERGAAALVATTDLDEALELADRLFVVDGGRLFECERDRAAVASLLAQRAA